MLVLRTGLPGSGKTLNTIKELDEEFGRDPKNPDKELRPIYYNGIPELDLTKLTANWIEFDTPDEWFNLPHGSIIVIDEAQRIFPVKDSRKEAPEKVTRFETHRHQGLDIHLVTQDPKLLSSHVRRLVGKHVHMYRPFGGEKLERHEYEWCCEDPNRRSNFRMAQSRKPKLDAKYFGVYKSAQVHTHKFKLPNYVWKIPLMLALVVAAAGAMAYVILGIDIGPKVPEKADKPASEVVAPAADGKPGTIGKPVDTKPGAKGFSTGDSTLTVDEYVDTLKPRIEDDPRTAPRYDQLNRPKDIPRMICTMSEDPGRIEKAKDRGQPVGKHKDTPYTCQCYTQQVTRVKTTAEFCRDVVMNGYFIDTDLPQQPVYGKTPQNSSPSVPAHAVGAQELTAPRGISVTGIPYTREPRTLQ